MIDNLRDFINYVGNLNFPSICGILGCLFLIIFNFLRFRSIFKDIKNKNKKI